MKQFIFLYPIKEYFDCEIRNGGYNEKGGEAAYRQKYKRLLNQCLALRYRQKGFVINFAVFNGSLVSDVIDFCPSDRIIEVGLDIITHMTQRADKTHPYPDFGLLVRKLGKVDKLVIAGFHMWDCVEKLARTAFSVGINTLVDEDMTELFGGRISRSGFAADKYPSLNFRKINGRLMSEFLRARETRPWLWQNY